MPARPIRDLWRREVIRTSSVSDGTKLLLIVMADDMREDGYVSVPRDELARRLDRTVPAAPVSAEQGVTGGVMRSGVATAISADNQAQWRSEQRNTPADLAEDRGAANHLVRGG